MDEKIKTWTLRLPAKESPNMEKALFDWPIVLQYDVKAKYRLISRKFFGHEVFSPVRLLFLFDLRVFISRPYENRSNNGENKDTGNDSCKNKFAHYSKIVNMN